MNTIAELQQMRVMPDMAARVVINERTGTVAVGHNVRISPVAIAHGGLSLQILPKNEVKIDPDNPENRTEQIVWENPVTNLRDDQAPNGVIVDPYAMPGTLSVIEGTTVEAISNALNALGARPKDVMAIFQAIDRMGALHAELIIM